LKAIVYKGFRGFGIFGIDVEMDSEIEYHEDV